ncbi:unnamed protein product [Paramecium sonneborni]|uniref:Uncharacterized protein n=1 Tax=Paramecium sonneborni TaxID=65129 RepID=A0A8S1RE77_9CILI|nr:unnamed protein product [Paramecium sonneborni]
MSTEVISKSRQLINGLQVLLLLNQLKEIHHILIYILLELCLLLKIIHLLDLLNLNYGLKKLIYLLTLVQELKLMKDLLHLNYYNILLFNKENNISKNYLIQLNSIQINYNKLLRIKFHQTIISNCEKIDHDYGTLLIKDQIIQTKEEPDFLKWNKLDQEMNHHFLIRIEHSKEISLEALIINMNLEERKQLKNQIEQQMNQEIQQVKSKYLTKLDLLNLKIKEEEDKQKQPLNLPFSFQVSQEVFQQLANVKTPLIKSQQVKQAKPTPFEFIPKQKL